MKKQKLILSVLEWIVVLSSFVIFIAGGMQMMNENNLIGLAIILCALVNLCFGYALFFILQNTFEIRKGMKLFEEEEA